MNSLPKQIKCKITPDLIKIGKKQWCSYCPAALAIKHAFVNYLLNVLEIEVKEYEIELTVGKTDFDTQTNNITSLIIQTPKRLRKFIDNFDSGIKVKPMNFILKINQ